MGLPEHMLPATNVASPGPFGGMNPLVHETAPINFHDRYQRAITRQLDYPRKMQEINEHKGDRVSCDTAVKKGWWEPTIGHSVWQKWSKLDLECEIYKNPTD